MLQVHPWDPLGALPDAPVFTRQSILALVLVVASAARQMTSGSQSDQLRWPSHIAGKQSALSKAAGLAQLLQSLRESSADAELDAELELAMRALSRWTQHLLGIKEYSEYPSVAEPKNAEARSIFRVEHRGRRASRLAVVQLRRMREGASIAVCVLGSLAAASCGSRRATGSPCSGRP